MYDRSKNEITFPHIIPSRTLGGKSHTWNDVNGGSKRLADLCIEPNTFFGGNVLILGWIKEYGMYACQQKDTGDIIGFYVHEPDKLTKVAKKMIQDYFADKTVKFVLYSPRKVTASEIKKLKELKEYYRDHGMSPNLVDTASAEELENLMKAIESGKAETPMAIAEVQSEAPMLEQNAEHEHDGSKLSESAFERRKAQRKFVK